jgi:hypothetical protein
MTRSKAETKNRMLPVAIATFFILILFSFLLPVVGKQEIVSLTTRYDSNGHGITVNYLVDAPDGQVRSILVAIPDGNGVIKLGRKSDGTITHTANRWIFARLALRLHKSSIATAMPDVPTDSSTGLSSNLMGSLLYCLIINWYYSSTYGRVCPCRDEQF